MAPDDGLGQIAALRGMAPRVTIDKPATLRGYRAFNIIGRLTCKFLRAVRKGDIDTFVPAVTEYFIT